MVEALQGKMCENSLPSGVGRSLEPKFQGEGVVPGKYFLVSITLLAVAAVVTSINLTM